MIFMARHLLMGLPIDDLDLSATLAKIDEYVAARTPRQHTVLNAAKVVYAHEDPVLLRSINESSLIHADGQAVVWAAKALGVPIYERIAGIDLMAALVAHSELKGYRVYFLGARKEILDKMLERFRAEFPKLQIAGSRNGYFKDDEAAGVADRIRESRADILFVAMPTPKKENFIHDQLARMQVPFSMGVGGSFDVFAGLVARAPVWVQRAGGEWLYRLLQEPRRLARRYAVTNTLFVGKLAGAVVRRVVSRPGVKKP